MLSIKKNHILYFIIISEKAIVLLLSIKVVIDKNELNLLNFQGLN